MQLWDKKWTLWRLAIIVMVLLIFFACDDLLMIFLFSKMNFLYSHRGLYWFLYFATLFGSLILALLVLEAMRRQPVSGQEGLVGARGRVVRKTAQGYQVQVDGEIWQAHAKETLQAEDDVLVESIEGLVLQVIKTEKHFGRHKNKS